MTEVRSRDIIARIKIYTFAGGRVSMPAEYAQHLITLAEKTLNKRDEWIEREMREYRWMRRTFWICVGASMASIALGLFT